MSFIKTLVLSFLLIGSFGISAKENMNVLFIAIDDLNDWVGVMGGNSLTLTPSIDALAQRGTLFANAHCAAPACNPSRVSLLTGMAPANSGIYYNNQDWRQSKTLQGILTIP